MTETKPGADAPRIAPDPRPDAVMPTVPAIEREERAEDLEPGDAVDGPIAVSAEVPETIEATIDFSEVELADEFSEPELAVTPGGLLPMEPSPIEGRLRKAPLRVPDELEECGGFTLFGRRIKSLLYTTDVAVIRNSNADAIFAVYPFTAQPAITQALLTASEAPVFVGVGGGTTTGKRAVQLAAVSEMQGAAGVVVNSPAPPEMIEQICAIIDIPVIAEPAPHRLRRTLVPVGSRDGAGGCQRRHLDATLGTTAAGRYDAPVPRGGSQARSPRYGPRRCRRRQPARERASRRPHPRRAHRQGNHERTQAPETAAAVL